MFSNSLFLTGIEIFAEMSDEVEREMSLIVGGELVEDKPVRATAVFHHGAEHGLSFSKYCPSGWLFCSPDAGRLTAPVAPGAQYDGASSEGRNDNRGEPPHQLKSRQGQEGEEPKPQDKIDLETEVDIEAEL